MDIEDNCSPMENCDDKSTFELTENSYFHFHSSDKNTKEYFVRTAIFNSGSLSVLSEIIITSSSTLASLSHFDLLTFTRDDLENVLLLVLLKFEKETPVDSDSGKSMDIVDLFCNEEDGKKSNLKKKIEPHVLKVSCRHFHSGTIVVMIIW
jgi:hypothetical protein